MGLCKFHFAGEMDLGWPALTSRAIELGSVVMTTLPIFVMKWELLAQVAGERQLGFMQSVEDSRGIWKLNANTP